MTDIADLIIRLESATEGSRELDALIAIAAGDFDFEKIERMGMRDGETFRHDAQADGAVKSYVVIGSKAAFMRRSNTQHYTESVDAALTLIPDGIRYSLYRRGSGMHAVVLGGTAQSASGKALPLAICLASLRARQSTPSL